MASLFETYVSAGFVPAAFWGLTPRLLVCQLRAAARRRDQAQALAAEAAWVGAHHDHRALQKYTAALRGEETSLPPEALAGMARAATTGLPEMTWADYLKQRG